MRIIKLSNDNELRMKIEEAIDIHVLSYLDLNDLKSGTREVSDSLRNKISDTIEKIVSLKPYKEIIYSVFGEVFNPVSGTKVEDEKLFSLLDETVEKFEQINNYYVKNQPKALQIVAVELNKDLFVVYNSLVSANENYEKAKFLMDSANKNFKENKKEECKNQLIAVKDLLERSFELKIEIPSDVAKVFNSIKQSNKIKLNRLNKESKVNRVIKSIKLKV